MGSAPELHECGGGLVVVGLDVGDPGVVVDGDMQVGVTDAVPLGFGVAASVDPPPAPWRDLAGFLDVEAPTRREPTVRSGVSPHRWAGRSTTGGS
ncbi:MAG: hypothetical protein OXF75_13720, partial [Acidimicrobiaceae bacterium]|nr:hypothetical protein [Acidimicrobiaceae bacterium]